MILIPIALWLNKGAIQTSLLIGAIFLVLIVELLNSALECLTDRISIEYHELSGRAKDLGSAAVFIAIVNCILIWLIVLCL